MCRSVKDLRINAGRDIHKNRSENSVTLEISENPLDYRRKKLKETQRPKKQETTKKKQKHKNSVKLRRLQIDSEYLCA